jgi:hypothetical protein
MATPKKASCYLAAREKILDSTVEQAIDLLESRGLKIYLKRIFEGLLESTAARDALKVSVERCTHA